MQPTRRDFICRAAAAATCCHNAAAGTPPSPVIDSHQHFWNPAEQRLPPLPPKAAVLGRAYLPDDLRPELRAAGIDYTVLVQAYPQAIETNRWLFRRANMTDFVAGVVAWIDLQRPAAAASELDLLQKERKFSGIRHVVEDEPDLAWILRAPVVQSLRELARRKVPFDMLVRPEHLANVLRLLDRVPELNVVIDHIGKPRIAGGGSPGWAGHMTEIASHPRVFCKISGMVTEADWQHWSAADLKPYIRHVIEAFGWDRVMYGSDWPVCLLAGSYRQVWSAFLEAAGPLEGERRRKLLGANAAHFYQLRAAMVTGRNANP
jgi:L-fuconolactonase